MCLFIFFTNLQIKAKISVRLKIKLSHKHPDNQGEAIEPCDSSFNIQPIIAKPQSQRGELKSKDN